MRTRIFFTSFAIMFALTYLLCTFTKQPLLLRNDGYGSSVIISFAVFVAVWCLLLNYISLPVLHLFKPVHLSKRKYDGFYILGTFITLQVVTLLAGYIESSMTRGIAADWLYYYKGVTNSWIYIVTGNITALITASMYANYQLKKKEAEEKASLSLKQD